MRRVLIVPFLTLLTAVSCGSQVAGLGAGPEERAADAARETARDVAKELYSSARWPAKDIGHRAADMDGVEVLRTRPLEPGGRVGGVIVMRVSGTAREDWPHEQQTVTVRRCFEVVVSDAAEWGEEPEGVECPPGEPIEFGPWPETPEIPEEELAKALPEVPDGGVVREAEVRAAIASLDLDPQIEVRVGREGDVVGAVLSIKPRLADARDCTLVRVAPGRTSVWVPPRIQRMLGEGGCSVGNATSPMPPPH